MEKEVSNMKSLFVLVMAVLMALSFSLVGFATQHKAVGNQQTVSSKMEIATGIVTSVDPQGKAIAISEKIAGKGAMDVGTIVDKDTIVKMKGKEATLKDVKVGDSVTIHYVKSDDLYAKEIDMR